MAKSEHAVAIIPARGGSKRIPNKNALNFFGHPMLAYTVVAAIKTRLFERVLVSTENLLIGRIAEWYGAEHLLRPKELADDTSDLVGVSLHALDYLAAKGYHPDSLCQLMPNCPMRRSDDIVEQHRLFEQHKRGFQISVVPYRGVYPHWAVTKNDRFQGSFIFGNKFFVPSQELETTYCPTGAIWWVDVAQFRLQKAFYGEPFHVAPMDPNRGMDIDVMEDLELAQLLVTGLMHRDRGAPLETIEVDPIPKEFIHD